MMVFMSRPMLLCQGIQWCHSLSPVTLTFERYDLCKVTVASVFLVQFSVVLQANLVPLVPLPPLTLVVYPIWMNVRVSTHVTSCVWIHMTVITVAVMRDMRSQDRPLIAHPHLQENVRSCAVFFIL